MPHRLDRRSYALMALGIAILTLAIYSQVGNFDFNNFDDPDYAAQNEIVKRGFTLEGIRWAFSSNFMGNWHPLTWISHMLDCQFFGLNAGAHHWISVLIHLSSSLLLLWVLYRYTEALERSAFVAALFAVHPLHVESVAWIAERKDLLSALFWILTMWAYLRYVESRSVVRYAFVLTWFAMGLMSKPMVVTLPCVLLLLDYWPLKRITVSRDWLKLVLEKSPLFALTFASCVVTFVVQKQGGAVGSLEKFSFGARVANALVAYVAYIGKTILPDNLCAFYPHPGAWQTWQVVGSAFLLAIITTAVLGLWRRAPYLAVGWFWYIGTLVPVIGLVQVGEQAFADRYTYVPLIGFFIATVWGAAELATRLKWPRVPIRIAVVTLLLIYAGVASFQVRHWKNSETVFRHALDVTKDNYIAHYNLGQALSVQQRIDEAIPHYYAALRIKPDHEGAHNNLGLTYALHGQWQKATNHYSEALRVTPKNPEIHFNMGVAQLGLGDITNAIEHLRFMVQERPTNSFARRYLADALAAIGNAHGAVESYREAVRINPAETEALNNLAWVLATHPDPAVRNGKEAVQLAERACELTKYNAPLMLGTLAAAYAEAGQFSHAVETARGAETLAAQQGNAALAAKNRALREKYEQNQPHRQ